MNYAALFRSLNVGGKNIVKMEDLRQFLLDLQLDRVKTYIQSGNAVFQSSLDETALRHAIGDGFHQRFGFSSDVLIRSVDELLLLIDLLPFSNAERLAAEAADPKAEHFYVYFLDYPPEPAQLDTLRGACVGADQVCAGQRELYLLCDQSIRKSKLAARASKTFGTATVRNWKTVCKLHELMSAL
ncbi:MAG: hypothetical protein H6Q60_1274 [Oscillospiraceae bacterium]|nr:hypothetical protein [Oscillospiraceae bacterium]